MDNLYPLHTHTAPPHPPCGTEVPTGAGVGVRVSQSNKPEKGKEIDHENQTKTPGIRRANPGIKTRDGISLPASVSATAKSPAVGSIQASESGRVQRGVARPFLKPKVADFAFTFTAEGDGPPVETRMRRLLKAAKRRYGLRVQWALLSKANPVSGGSDTGSDTARPAKPATNDAGNTCGIVQMDGASVGESEGENER